MRGFLLLSILGLVVQQIVAPPVSKTHEEEDKNNHVDEQVEDSLGVEYERYLKEVINALETDPEFRAKLEKANETDIKSGKIAKELDFVNHHVRTKLDELKRTELIRLNQLIDKQNAEHLDHKNAHSFEVEDLKKLIQKTNKDLAEADERRRKEFKEYEMEKKFEQEQKMKGLNEQEKKKYAEELEKVKEKHKKHQPLHHPGSEQQLKEVWEKQDHMEDQEFNPQIFFASHDVDGNGYWDEIEVKALFLKELDKLYTENPADLPERAEELERMREHVFSETDTNRDGLISYNEFLAQTKKEEFHRDSGWESLDEQKLYSEQEYDAFEKRRQEEIKRMIAQGLLPPMPDYGHQGQFSPQYVDPNQAHHQGQVPLHQQQYQGQVPVHPEQVAGYQGQAPVYQGQVPIHQGQIPVHQGQVPIHQGQVPVHQGQVPVQQQQYQGQIPVQQQQYQVPVQNQYPGQVQGQHQAQQPIQQQHQPPVQQVPINQHQPNPAPVQQAVQQPVGNSQHVQGNAAPVAHQQQQPVQNIPKHQPAQAEPAQHGNANVHHVSPNVVQT